MKRVFALVAAIMILGVTMLSGSQAALAGGSPFNALTFPGASAQSCGTWQASGLGGQASPNWFAIYSVTDGNGQLLSLGLFTKIPDTGTVAGNFWRKPTKNPIHFTAFTSFAGKVYSIGDIRMDDPCLAPSQSSQTPIPSQTVILRPSITLAMPTRSPATLPHPLTITPTNLPAQGPSVFFGCTQVRVSGVVSTVKAAYIRAMVSLASDLTHSLGGGLSQITNQYYSMTMNILPQPPGTHLVVSVGQWDGANYLEPATILSGDCVTPPPTVAPTMILTAMPTQAGVGQVSIAAICSGVTIQGTSGKSQISVELDSINNGPSVIGAATFNITPGQFLVTTSFFHPPFPTGTLILVKLTTSNPGGVAISLGQFQTTVNCPVVPTAQITSTPTLVPTITLTATTVTGVPQLGKLTVAPARTDPSHPGYFIVEPGATITISIDHLQNIASLQFSTPPDGWRGNGFVLTDPIFNPGTSATITVVVPTDNPGRNTMYQVWAKGTNGQNLSSNTLSLLIDPASMPQVSISISAIPDHIKVGECVTVSWTVTNLQVDDVIHLSASNVDVPIMSTQGTFQDCPKPRGTTGGSTVPAMYIMSVTRNNATVIARDAEVVFNP